MEIKQNTVFALQSERPPKITDQKLFVQMSI